MVKNLCRISVAFLFCLFVLCACSVLTSNDCTKNAEENATGANQFPDGSIIDP